MKKILLFTALFVACNDPTAVVIQKETEIQVVEIPTIVPGEIQIVEIPVSDTVVVNVLINIINEFEHENEWLRDALERIERIECADHPFHLHKEVVCEIAREELSR